MKQLVNPINSDQPLGNGYLLLAGLCDQFWDGLYPLPDEDGQEQRIGNLNWLLPRSARLVREIPMADSQHCQRALNDLEKSVDERLGIEDPGFSTALFAPCRGVLSTHAHIEPNTPSSASSTTQYAVLSVASVGVNNTQPTPRNFV